MRQPQHNNNNNKNRMRGRGRKPSNPTNRNFESNGPDVKIRGNAALIAEKYTTLARDALSSGDRVIAENYLQHAEHYNRIVSAANLLREEAQAANPRHSNTDNSHSGNDQEDNNKQVNEADSNNTTSSDASSGDDDSVRENRRPNNRNANRNASTAPRKAVRASNDSDEEEVGEQSEPSKNRRPRRTSRKVETQTSESISKDAAALPQGLFKASSSDDEAASADE